tara:strand:- start:9240 stop:10901 length:1662 start_codon:yes stop_codon:yes gene_type:complete
MKFGTLALNQAKGAILAHTTRLDKKVLKKGHILDDNDILLLEEHGLKEVTCAQLEYNDIPENEASHLLAISSAENGVKVGTPFAGRCNIYSNYEGLVLINSCSVDSINLVDETLTLGTLHTFEKVEKGQIVATVKVIPFSTPKPVVDECVSIAKKGKPIIEVVPIKKLKISLIQTRLPGTKESILNSTSQVISRRLSALNNYIDQEIRCDHNEKDISISLQNEIEKNIDLIIIASASAIVDRRDIIPQSIIHTGGNIEHFGMPVDPGNLLLLANNGATKIIGLPGCARSIKLNGFDLVLQRLACGINVSSKDIMLMGAGGLLTEITSRPMPRDNIDKETIKISSDKISKTKIKHIGAIILAGGQSRRMGKINKLQENINGKPMVSHTVDTVIEAGIKPIIVVTGYDSSAIKKLLKDKKVTFVHNASYDNGVSTSLKTGIRALPNGIDGVIIILADMPDIKEEVYYELIDKFDPDNGKLIGVPTSKGKRGNPVLWGSKFFPYILEVSGDVGARHLIGEFSDYVYEIECNQSVITDIDTPIALEKIRKGKPQGIK